MDKSLLMPDPDDSSRALPAHFAQQIAEEHVAVLENPGNFDLLRRKGDLLDEGVAAVFGLVDTSAELLGLCFDAGKFTPAEATRWLAGRGFTPLVFIPKARTEHGAGSVPE